MILFIVIMCYEMGELKVVMVEFDLYVFVSILDMVKIFGYFYELKF